MREFKPKHHGKDPNEDKRITRRIILIAMTAVFLLFIILLNVKSK